VQYFLFLRAGTFLNIWREIRYANNVNNAEIVPILPRSIDFFFHTLLAPQPTVVEGVRNIPGWGVIIISSQNQAVLVTPLSILILGLWLLLWMLGALAVSRGRIATPAALIVTLSFCYFYALHVANGGEIFLPDYPSSSEPRHKSLISFW
jgi:hypothetical protein